MEKSVPGSISYPLIGVLALFLVWTLVSYFRLVPPFILASPDEVLRALSIHVLTADFWRNIGISMGRISVGFLLSFGMAVIFAYLMILSISVYQITFPAFSIVRYLPVPALVPFLILWFGVGEIEKISVVFIGVFFQLIFMVLDGLKGVPSGMQEVAKTLGATKAEIVTTILFRAAGPHIYDSARVTFAWAWGWVMLAEVVGADSGLGFMLIRAQRFLISADMLVALLTIGALGLATDVVFVLLRKALFRWN